ncbi:MAG: Ig-like domain-containing protein [Candidatus Methylomirabilales bacterium]
MERATLVQLGAFVLCLVIFLGTIFLAHRDPGSPGAPPTPNAVKTGAVVTPPPAAPTTPKPPEARSSPPVPSVPSAAGIRGDRPKVARFGPTNQTPNHRDAAIVVRFDRPMDRSSTELAFQIHPAVPGRFQWPNSKTLLFWPKGLLDLNTEYVVTISEKATDAEQWGHLIPHRWSFTTVSSITFTRDIKPLLRQGCSSCHSQGGLAAGVRIDSYDAVQQYIAPGQAAQSPLVQAFEGQGPHQEIRPSIQAKAHRVRDWIDRFGMAQ